MAAKLGGYLQSKMLAQGSCNADGTLQRHPKVGVSHAI
jgi:hypothetical protein